ncbi:MAG: hypothetical protein U9N78_02020, partial [Actinomycetota bacterium]|nr:hypothetical protein [Actinomycetota bacterium]
VTVSDGHYEGDALNIAARIQALAPLGGLSISGPIYQELDEPALRFRPGGAHRLKNIPEAVEVYEFVDLPGDGSSAKAAASLSLEIPTVAVLPIHTDDVEDRVRPIAGMIRADIIHRLASIPELNVVDAVDATLGGSAGHSARYMLETGVHQFGDQLRVYAMLYDVTTMNVVKSHKMLSSIDEVLELSDQLSADVAQSIEVDLVVGVPAGLYAELDDPATIEKVYLGWYHFRSNTREGWLQGLDLFRQVADSHPHLPYGWVLAAFAEWLGAVNGWSSDFDEAIAAAREYARKGKDTGDLTGMAQAVEAAVLMTIGDIDGAIEALESLEIVRPTCDVTYGLEGSLKRYLGQWEGAVDSLDVAMRLTGI